MNERSDLAATLAARPPSRSKIVDGVRVGVCAIVLVPVLRQARHLASAKDPFDERRPAKHAPEMRMAEAVGLAQAIDLDVMATDIISIATPRPATLLGRGKVDEIKTRVHDGGIELVIIDHALTPIQQRNLERAWATKVLDRTGLILEIFGRRAQTREGRLQVELAHLSYQKSRLVRSWTHLERQRGGAGFLGGPGETQIELDRRLIEDRIEALKRELADVVRTRELHRAGRRKVPYPIVAIVGYTNAGKSTLFNRITDAGVLAKDQVFATLDPTMREIRLPSGRKAILSDTVGFISDLPTTLVAAFRATLEEVIEADLILHVRDIAAGETEAQKADVEAVLRDLGINAASADAPLLEVWNKIDLVPPERRIELTHDARRNNRPPVLVSAVTGEGVGALLAAVDATLGADDELLKLTLPGREGRLMHWLHQHAHVRQRTVTDSGDVVFEVRVDPHTKGQLAARLAAAGLPGPRRAAAD